jgi:hypothetical protein
MTAISGTRNHYSEILNKATQGDAKCEPRRIKSKTRA